MAEVKRSPFGDPPAAQQPVKRSPFGDPPAEQQPPPPVSTTEDVLRSIPSSLRTGTEMLVSFPGEVNQMTQRAASRVARALFGDQLAGQIGEYVPQGLQSEGISAGQVRNVTNQMAGGQPYEPQTRAGRYTRSIGEQVPGAFLGPGRMLTKALIALLAGGGSEAAGELAEGTGYEDAARAAGGLAGGLAGGVVRPGQTTRQAARDANIATLEREGVPLTAGQRTGSKRLQYLESEIGGDDFDRLIDRQRSVFTDAAMRRLGEAAGPALPEDLARARTRIGGEFDRLSANAVVPFDQQLQSDITNAGALYEQQASIQVPAVRQMFNSLIDKAALNGGVLRGDQYQDAVTKLRLLSEGADPTAQQALDAYRNALDDAVERSLTGPPLDEWRNARRQYANLMTVERAMTGGGMEPATGMISPVRLRSAISGGGQGPAAIAEGRSNLTDLANAGVSATKDLPQSGTASRQAARGVPAAAVGIGTGVATGDIPTGIGAGVGAAIAAPLMGKMVMNPASQWLLGHGGMSDDQRMLLAALMAGRVGAGGGQP